MGFPRNIDSEILRIVVIPTGHKGPNFLCLPSSRALVPLAWNSAAETASLAPLLPAALVGFAGPGTSQYRREETAIRTKARLLQRGCAALCCAPTSYVARQNPALVLYCQTVRRPCTVRPCAEFLLGCPGPCACLTPLCS